MGMHPFNFLLHSDLYVVSLHRAITERLPCSIVWQAACSGWADVNAALVSWLATSCWLPGPHPSDVLMIWHAWSKALFVSWQAFFFSRGSNMHRYRSGGASFPLLIIADFKREDAEKALEYFISTYKWSLGKVISLFSDCYIFVNLSKKWGISSSREVASRLCS